MIRDTLSGIYPNSEERAQLTFINIARLFPQDFVKSKYGKYEYGTQGPQTVFYDDGGTCGVAAEKPLWHWPDATEAARFHAVSNQKCQTVEVDPHKTCAADCHLFADCSFKKRVLPFYNHRDGGAFIASEGLCGANMCYTDGHCGAMFKKERVFMGVGFALNANGADYLYVDNGPASTSRRLQSTVMHPIPIGTHYDERIKFHKNDTNTTAAKHLVFEAIYYHPTISAKAGYVHYQGKRHNMTQVFGTANRALYTFSAEIPSGCEPYYFEFATATGNFRLPENSDYFFGTSWSPWSFWNTTIAGFPPQCEENHYYVNKGTVVANGGPKIDGIPEANCVGCTKVTQLLNENLPIVPNSCNR